MKINLMRDSHLEKLSICKPLRTGIPYFKNGLNYL